MNDIPTLIHEHMLHVRSGILVLILVFATFIASRLKLGGREITFAAFIVVVLLFAYILIFNAAYLPNTK